MDDAQHATVLAALRYYQMHGLGDPNYRPDEIHEIATNGGKVLSSLDQAGIDALCSSLNLCHQGCDDANEAEIHAARRLYASDQVNIDMDAKASRGNDGTWVQAWVLVPKSELPF